jgi:putative transposase
VIDLPRTTTADRKRLANAQRVFARRAKGSRNWAKARRRVARLQARYARRRKDAVHKATTMIAKETRRHRHRGPESRGDDQERLGNRGESGARSFSGRANFNGTLLDVSPRMIRTMLEYKAPWHGSRVIVVGPVQKTSQYCNACGTVDAVSRISRSRFVCTNCGSMPTSTRQRSSN